VNADAIKKKEKDEKAKLLKEQKEHQKKMEAQFNASAVPEFSQNNN
jgi:hypothetical protein